jgi:crossover junction endodeoxyribonuclease RuvC
MLQNIVALPDKPQYFDATDALAVAVCHHFQENKLALPESSKPVTRKRDNSWESFLKTHSHRVAG